jgi:hypothetical protein
MFGLRILLDLVSSGLISRYLDTWNMLIVSLVGVILSGWMSESDDAENGARLIPSGISRFDPIFYALDSPTDLLGVQVVTDRNCLRKIYSIFNPTTAVYAPKPFRMDAQKVGNVIMFTRNEAADKRYAEKPHPFCYSKSHELATMRSQLKDTTSCHRLIRYEFGGIDMIVRFELDAVAQAGAVPEIKSGSTTFKSLEDAISGMTLGNNDRQIQLPKHFESKAGIKVYRIPYPPAPLSSFIEKKTRTAKGQLDYIDIYGQLVFSLTPHLYVARHNRGNFQDLEQVSLGSGKLAKIAKDTEGVMGKVAGMLAEMMEVVHEFGEVSFVWSGQGGMVEVWKGEVQA